MKLISNFLIIYVLVIFSFSITAAQQNKIRIACVGNSITQGGSGTGNYPAQLSKILGNHYDVRNFGVSGRTLLRKGDAPYWNEQAFKNAKDFDPHIVIIKLGTNDSKPQNWVYKNEFFKDYVDLVNEFRKNGKKPQIYVAKQCPAFKINWGINPDIIKNEVIPLTDSVRKITNAFLVDFNTPFLNRSDLFPDGIHPSTAGYLFMAQIVDSTLKKSPSGLIRYLYPTKSIVEKGEAAKIYWETTPGTSVTLNGAKVNSTDSLNVILTKTTTYQLITSGAFTDTSTITVEYLPSGKIKSYNNVPKVLEKNKGEGSFLQWQTSAESIVTLNGEPVSSKGNTTVFPKETTLYELKASGETTDIQTIKIEVLEAEQINRALNGSGKASSGITSFTIDKAIDGNGNTYWKSGLEKAPWFYIDLNRSFEVYKIKINWGNNFGKSYILQSIDDLGAVSEIFNENNGNGESDEFNNLNVVGRYFGIYCGTKSNPDSSCTIKEFEVYARQNITDIDNSETVIADFKLSQNYPNPFNPTTTIAYTIDKPSQVKLVVYDILGQEIKTLINEYKSPGTYSQIFDARSLPSGLYFYQLNNSKNVATKSMVLTK